nr:hypothetical protein CFP56_09531 [Quercus suber]
MPHSLLGSPRLRQAIGEHGEKEHECLAWSRMQLDKQSFTQLSTRMSGNSECEEESGPVTDSSPAQAEKTPDASPPEPPNGGFDAWLCVFAAWLVFINTWSVKSRCHQVLRDVLRPSAKGFDADIWHLPGVLRGRPPLRTQLQRDLLDR